MLNICMTFGLWLKRHLDSINMKPSELAAKMGVTPGQVSQLFSGNRSPGRKTISKLSIALDIPAGELHDLVEGRKPLPVCHSPGEQGKSEGSIATLRKKLDPITEEIVLLLLELDDDIRQEILKTTKEKKLIANIMKKRRKKKGGDE